MQKSEVLPEKGELENNGKRVNYGQQISAEIVATNHSQ
jgi:hypothetical protein